MNNLIDGLRNLEYENKRQAERLNSEIQKILEAEDNRITRNLDTKINLQICMNLIVCKLHTNQQILKFGEQTIVKKLINSLDVILSKVLHPPRPFSIENETYLTNISPIFIKEIQPHEYRNFRTFNDQYRLHSILNYFFIDSAKFKQFIYHLETRSAPTKSMTEQACDYLIKIFESLSEEDNNKLYEKNSGKSCIKSLIKSQINKEIGFVAQTFKS